MVQVVMGAGCEGSQLCQNRCSEVASCSLNGHARMQKWTEQVGMHAMAGGLQMTHVLHLGQAAWFGQVSVDDVQSILLWDDPWKSAKALTAGLYGLICLRALVAGERPKLHALHALQGHSSLKHVLTALHCGSYGGCLLGCFPA